MVVLSYQSCVRTLLTSVALVGIVGSAQAKEWFNFDRADALQRIKAAVGRLELIAPVPDLRCRPRALIVRYCDREVVEGLSLHISTVLDKDTESAGAADRKRFSEQENAGKVHEIEVNLSAVDARDPRSADMFQGLCTAIILAVRPSLGVKEARLRYATYMKRSINKSATSDGEIVLVGNPDTLIIDSWPDGSASCKASAASMHREPK